MLVYYIVGLIVTYELLRKRNMLIANNIIIGITMYVIMPLLFPLSLSFELLKTCCIKLNSIKKHQYESNSNRR